MEPWAESFASFIAMGGHGLYVWLAYGATAALLAVNLLSTRAAWRRYRREIMQERSANED